VLNDWKDTLLTISEIAIAIIGFTGLIGILARRQRVEMFSEEFFKLRFMLEYGLLTLGSALLPFLVFNFGLSDPTSWRISSGLWVGAGFSYVAVNRGQFFMQMREPGVLKWIFGSGDVIFSLLNLANALGIFFEPSSLPYVSAVYYCLVAATVGFVRLIALVWTPSDTPPES
jgi:hypothetical protein